MRGKFVPGHNEASRHEDTRRGRSRRIAPRGLNVNRGWYTLDENVHFALEHAMKAYRGNSSIILLFL